MKTIGGRGIGKNGGKGCLIFNFQFGSTGLRRHYGANGMIRFLSFVINLSLEIRILKLRLMSLNKTINYLLLLFLFLLPWQSRIVYERGYLNGGYWEYGSLSLFATEILLWLIVVLFAIDKFGKKEFWKKITGKEHWKKHKNNLFLAIFLMFGLFLS